MTLQPSLFKGHKGPRIQPAVAVRRLAAADAILGALMASVGRYTVTGEDLLHPVASLARAITGQQLSGPVARVIYARLQTLLGRVTPDRLLAADPEALRGVGLSYAKVAALRDLAQKARDGVVPTAAKLHQLSDDEIVERLTAVKGIGRWTVEMLLLFHLGRPDVLPVDDLGIRKGFQLTYGERDLPKPKVLSAFGERWRPYRSVASWYLWRSLDLQKATNNAPSGAKAAKGA